MLFFQQLNTVQHGLLLASLLLVKMKTQIFFALLTPKVKVPNLDKEEEDSTNKKKKKKKALENAEWVADGHWFDVGSAAINPSVSLAVVNCTTNFLKDSR